jgi:hypothetical protein
LHLHPLSLLNCRRIDTAQCCTAITTPIGTLNA